MVRRTVPVAIVAAIVLGGCGDLSHDELGRRVDTLTALAAEGRLLARDVVHDRTKATFVRVHARQLSESADHEAEKVADARVEDASKGHAAETVELAERLGDALGTLAIHPGDEARASGVGRELQSIEDDLARLGERT
jgi:hypothetical protein